MIANARHRRGGVLFAAGSALALLLLVSWTATSQLQTSDRLLDGIHFNIHSTVEDVQNTVRCAGYDTLKFLGWHSDLFTVCPQCSQGFSMLQCLGHGSYSCTGLRANGMCFQCRTSGPPGAEPVLLLHGFPNNADYWLPLTDHWADAGAPLRTVACNLRGYSPGASPDNLDGYDSDALLADVWALADAAFGPNRTFHLVGHDHGAVLGWIAAAQPLGTKRIRSFVSLGMPHLDVLSGALYGEAAVPAQQFAVNYFNYFWTPYAAEQLGSILPPDGLKWYHGMIPDRVALPPVINSLSSFAGNLKAGGMTAMVEAVYALGSHPGEVTTGLAQSRPIGPVEVPTLLVCSTSDPYILCSDGFVEARTTSELVRDFDVFYNSCDGHLVISKCRSVTDMKTWNVLAQDEGEKAMEAITDFIEARR